MMPVARSSPRLLLQPNAQAPGLARRFTSELLQSWQCPQLLETAELLVSELVTNAVLHARTKIELRVALRRDVIRFDVIDSSGAPVLPRDAEAKSISGRGLRIVASLALQWGTSPLNGGKSVWFTLPRSSSARTAETV